MLSLLQNIFLFWPVDEKLDRGSLYNENLLLKDNFLQRIATSSRFLEFMITAKCRAQLRKTTVCQTTIFIDVTDKLHR